MNKVNKLLDLHTEFIGKRVFATVFDPCLGTKSYLVVFSRSADVEMTSSRAFPEEATILFIRIADWAKQRTVNIILLTAAR